MLRQLVASGIRRAAARYQGSNCFPYSIQQHSLVLLLLPLGNSNAKLQSEQKYPLTCQGRIAFLPCTVRRARLYLLSAAPLQNQEGLEEQSWNSLFSMGKSQWASSSKSSRCKLLSSEVAGFVLFCFCFVVFFFKPQNNN